MVIVVWRLYTWIFVLIECCDTFHMGHAAIKTKQQYIEKVQFIFKPMSQYKSQQSIISHQKSCFWHIFALELDKPLSQWEGSLRRHESWEKYDCQKFITSSSDSQWHISVQWDIIRCTMEEYRISLIWPENCYLFTANNYIQVIDKWYTSIFSTWWKCTLF